MEHSTVETRRLIAQVLRPTGRCSRAVVQQLADAGWSRGRRSRCTTLVSQRRRCKGAPCGATRKRYDAFLSPRRGQRSRQWTPTRDERSPDPANDDWSTRRWRQRQDHADEGRADAPRPEPRNEAVDLEAVSGRHRWRMRTPTVATVNGGGTIETLCIGLAAVRRAWSRSLQTDAGRPRHRCVPTSRRTVAGDGSIGGMNSYANRHRIRGGGHRLLSATRGTARWAIATFAHRNRADAASASEDRTRRHQRSEAARKHVRWLQARVADELTWSA